MLAPIVEDRGRPARWNYEEHGLPRADLLRRLEAGRQHSDNLVRFSIERDVPADDAWLAAQALLPQLVCDHHHMARAVAVFFRQKTAAHGRLHAEDIQKVITRLDTGDALRGTGAGQVHARRPHVRDSGEYVILVVIRQIGRRYAAAVLGLVDV